MRGEWLTPRLRRTSLVKINDWSTRAKSARERPGTPREREGVREENPETRELCRATGVHPADPPAPSRPPAHERASRKLSAEIHYSREGE